MTEPAFNVLFLCTHNPARSVMTEVLMNALPSRRFRAYWAGSKPFGALRPQVIEQLRVHGHDISGLRSKIWHDFTRPDAPHFDFVVTLCDMLIGHDCPDFKDHPLTGTWPLPDPAKFSGSRAERATLLNELYGSLKRQLEKIGGAVTTGRRAMRVGINGMGRIGRLSLRAALGGIKRPGDDPRAGSRLDVAHVNEIKAGAASIAHLVEFDSIHGRWRTTTSAEDDAVTVSNHRIGFSSPPSPGEAPWGDLGCDVVLECTGKFLKPDQLAGYFDRGVKRVIVAVPVKDDSALNVVVGVNDREYDPARHRLLTAASCTTNYLAPVVGVVHEAIGIHYGQITTIHGPDQHQRGRWTRCTRTCVGRALRCSRCSRRRRAVPRPSR